MFHLIFLIGRKVRINKADKEKKAEFIRFVY